MSYEIVRSLSLDLDNMKAKMNSACNNITPLLFDKHEINGNGQYKEINGVTEQEQFTLDLIKYVLGGEFKLRKSVSKRVRYAFLKTELKERELFDKHDILKSYSLEPKNTDDVPKIKALVETFKNAYNEKDEKVRKVLKVVEENVNTQGYYISKIKSDFHGYSVTTKNRAKVYESRKEIEIAQISLYHETVVENY
ncbi:hypothetical protein ACR56S_11820 [Staphylococcus hominis]|uniref:hypothetical protein n=1 Tax=Staphylococcus hominis TaxID=1290 RepID=UPI003DA01A8C